MFRLHLEENDRVNAVDVWLVLEGLVEWYSPSYFVSDGELGHHRLHLKMKRCAQVELGYVAAKALQRE